MLGIKRENDDNCSIFLINELSTNYNNNPYEEFNKKKYSEENNFDIHDTSYTTICINEDEEEKFLPSNLLSLSRNPSDILEDNNNNTFMNKLDINSEPFFPKNKSKFNNKNKIGQNIKNNNSNNECQNIKNKKKKCFVMKKGDWICYNCKNLNFAFRVKCNKCELNKEESEQRYMIAGQKILSKLNA